MFKIFDNFVAYDKNKQPYTFSLEKHTETANLHARVTEAGFALKSIGNRFILNSPGFTTGKLDANFAISYPYESTLRFQIIFGYDKKSRTGSAVQFTYDMGRLPDSRACIRKKRRIYARIRLNRPSVAASEKRIPAPFGRHKAKRNGRFD